MFNWVEAPLAYLRSAAEVASNPAITLIGLEEGFLGNCIAFVSANTVQRRLARGWWRVLVLPLYAIMVIKRHVRGREASIDTYTKHLAAPFGLMVMLMQ